MLTQHSPPPAPAPEAHPEAHPNAPPADYPVRILRENIADFPEFQTTAHWTDGVEMILVRAGRMRIVINGRDILARADDFLLIPPRRIYSFHAIDGERCDYIYILFGEDVFTSSKFVRDHFINLVLFNRNRDCYHTENNELLNRLVTAMYDLGERREESLQLDVIGHIHCLLSAVYVLFLPEMTKKGEGHDEMIVLLRRMMNYVYRHFDEKISIGDIAASVRVSKSTCFALFRKYAGQSPNSFVNDYRLTVAQHLLRNSRDSIAEVAFSCGFAHQSYFTELFSRKFGCTPLQYRKRREAEPAEA